MSSIAPNTKHKTIPIFLNIPSCHLYDEILWFLAALIIPVNMSNPIARNKTITVLCISASYPNK
jgi:hypothetical protein